MKRTFACKHKNFYHLFFFGLVLVNSLSQSRVANTQILLSKPLIEKWQRKIESNVNFTPTIGHDNIFIALSNGDLLSIALLDGSFNWETQIGGIISVPPISDDQAIYIASTSLAVSSSLSASQTPGTLRRISNENGVTIWMKTLNAPVCSGLVSNYGSIFGRISDGHLLAIEKKTGNILWSTLTPSALCTNLTLYNDRLFFEDKAGDIVSVEQNTGKELWRYQTHSAINTPISVVNKTLYFCTEDNYLFALDARSHRLNWRVPIGSNIQSLTPTNKGLLVVTLDNFVNLFTYQKGSKLWKRSLIGRVIAPPLVWGGAVLLVPLAGDECIILDLEDGKKLNGLTIGDDSKTYAAPLIVHNLLLITTPHRIVAFTRMLPVNHVEALEFHLR